MIVRGTLVWLGIAVVIAIVNAELALNVEHAWRYLEYQYDSVEEEADAIQSGAFYFRKNYPFDVEVVRDGRVFITVRREDGVPSTLNTITNVTGYGGGPLLKPYPDWSWTDIRNCDNLIEVFRVAQDECNRLWVLDNGKINDDDICPPKLLAFDLTTDKLVERVDLPRSWGTYLSGKGGLTTPIIDTVGQNCSETDVYIADALGQSLMIWNGKTTWTIDSPFFGPQPGGQLFSVHGIDFELARGLTAMAITREVPVMERLFYFRPLSSFGMYHARAVDFHSKKNDQRSIRYFEEPTQLTSQSVAQAFSSRGILFFSSVSDYTILCWNRHKPFVPENIVVVAKDEKTLQWASGMKIYQEDDHESLWVLTNRVQEIETHRLNFTKTNFRVVTGTVENLVRGTNCELDNDQ